MSELLVVVRGAARELVDSAGDRDAVRTTSVTGIGVGRKLARASERRVAL